MADSDNPLGYTTATEDLRKLLVTLGVPLLHFTEHSGKRGGATTAANLGMNAEDLQKLGHWKSAEMSVKYVDMSIARRIKLTEIIHG